MNRILAEFRAPWSRTLRVTSALSVGVLLMIVLIGLLAGPRQFLLWRVAMIVLPLLTLAAALAFVVRGYVLTDISIEVRRLGWSTSLPLAGLVSVTGEVDAWRGAVRLFGNGGLFAFTGWFWSRRLGRFRAFATDPGRAVMLGYADRKVMVTPHDPQHFIVRVRTLLGSLAHSRMGQ